MNRPPMTIFVDPIAQLAWDITTGVRDRAQHGELAYQSPNSKIAAVRVNLDLGASAELGEAMSFRTLEKGEGVRERSVTIYFESEGDDLEPAVLLRLELTETHSEMPNSDVVEHVPLPVVDLSVQQYRVAAATALSRVVVQYLSTGDPQVTKGLYDELMM